MDTLKILCTVDSLIILESLRAKDIQLKHLKSSNINNGRKPTIFLKQLFSLSKS